MTHHDDQKLKSRCQVINCLVKQNENLRRTKIVLQLKLKQKERSFLSCFESLFERSSLFSCFHSLASFFNNELAEGEQVFHKDLVVKLQKVRVHGFFARAEGLRSNFKRGRDD